MCAYALTDTERRALPILGVVWRYFPTEAEARRFARRAEAGTRHDEYPCEAFVSAEDDGEGNPWCVKVRNW